ncbi:MAG: Fe3+/spermidine/putrescine ABC transporter ATP-binding protein [Acidiferrobacteraceae bacterium]|jgi:spermidine/putrescine ABC transporter ATP-binding subunit|nr:Fe3+/spermidine/putrescine ABC transporter ATP-binding protein [Acidiferrobacteraceae bacterium]MDP6399690.1 ABC transporter ATP-binding protein [Arenicellales bacterium]MDP6550714.1 ABC transporter ATP-binding protein [Arenicellales bacterium]MDP6792292.1 ABC transporter ATP-binding protein [Arenicellales bacterium]MDP6920022.1 ABC transporter ATP-binding protein [Arenicellales bacterium]|tara:strand:+ start:901 stop:2001 length:1101 start_codon:yes stop_codon:yes gene_type:complete
MNHDAIISFQGVSKHFGSVKAIENASFDIQRGEFFSLLGPSGCGKTTLLRMVAGFEIPNAGEIVIDGQPMSAIPPNHRPVNMVFQNYAIFPHLDVRNNIAFGMRKAGLTRAELDKRIDEALELIKLPGYGKRGADELSGGQRQRVALARALIKQPKVLLLDEPLGALDKKLREQMQIELRQLQQQIGITFLFVTHDQEEALTLSDRIAVMSEGEVMEIASPGQLYESPGSRFVADFIGSMNFFEGEITSLADSAVIVQTPVLGDVEVTGSDTAMAPGQKVWVAIRPEKMQPVFSDPGAGNNSVAGTMGPSAYLGDRSHFYVHLPQREEPVLVALQNLERSMSHLHKPNQPVWLQWTDDAVVALPRD